MTQRRAFARHVNCAIPLSVKSSQTRRTIAAALTLDLTVKVPCLAESAKPSAPRELGRRVLCVRPRAEACAAAGCAVTSLFQSYNLKSVCVLCVCVVAITDNHLAVNATADNNRRPMPHGDDSDDDHNADRHDADNRNAIPIARFVPHRDTSAASKPCTPTSG
jgi:hypothetical protein